MLNTDLVNGSKIVSTPSQNGQADKGSCSSSGRSPFLSYSDEDRLLHQLFEKGVIDQTALTSSVPTAISPLPEETAPSFFALFGQNLLFKTKEGKPFFFCVNAFIGQVMAPGCWTALIGDGVFGYMNQNYISQVFDQMAPGLEYPIPRLGEGKKCTIYVHVAGLNPDLAANIRDILIKMITHSRFGDKMPYNPGAYRQMYLEVEGTAFTQLRSDFSNENQYLQFAMSGDFTLEMVIGNCAQTHFFTHDLLHLNFTLYPNGPHFYQAFIDKAAKIIHAVEWKVMNPKMLASLYCLQAASYRSYSKNLEKNLIDKLFPEAKSKWFSSLLRSTWTQDPADLPLMAARACYSLLTHGREKLAMEVWKEMLPETPSNTTGFLSLFSSANDINATFALLQLFGLFQCNHKREEFSVWYTQDNFKPALQFKLDTVTLLVPLDPVKALQTAIENGKLLKAFFQCFFADPFFSTEPLSSGFKDVAIKGLESNDPLVRELCYYALAYDAKCSVEHLVMAFPVIYKETERKKFLTQVTEAVIYRHTRVALNLSNFDGSWSRVLLRTGSPMFVNLGFKLWKGGFQETFALASELMKEHPVIAFKLLNSLQNLGPAEERQVLLTLSREFKNLNPVARLQTVSLLCAQFAQTKLDPSEIQQQDEIQSYLQVLIEEIPGESKNLLKFASPNTLTLHLLSFITKKNWQETMELWDEAKRRYNPSDEVRWQVLTALCTQFSEEVLEPGGDFEVWRAIVQTVQTPKSLTKGAAAVSHFLEQKEISSIVKEMFLKALELDLHAVALDLWSRRVFDLRVEQTLLMNLLNYYMKHQMVGPVVSLFSQLKDVVKDSSVVDFINRRIEDVPPESVVACRLFLLQRYLKVQNRDGINAQLNTLLSLSKNPEETKKFKELAELVPQNELVLHPQFSTHFTENEQLEKIARLLKVSKERQLIEKALDLAFFWDEAFLTLFFSYTKENKTKTNSFVQAFTKNEAHLIDQILNKAPQRFEEFLDLCQKLGVTPKLSEEQAMLCLERVPHSLRLSQIVRKKTIKQPERFIPLVNFLSANQHDAEAAAWAKLFHEQKAAGPTVSWISNLSDYDQKMELLLLYCDPNLKSEAEKMVQNNIKTHFAACVSLVEAYQMMSEKLMELFVASQENKIADLVCRYPHLSNFSTHIRQLIERGEILTVPQIEIFLTSAPATVETSQTAKRLNLSGLHSGVIRLVNGLMAQNEFDEAASWALIIPFELSTVKEVLQKGKDKALLAQILLAYRDETLAGYAKPLAAELIKKNVTLACSVLTAFGLMTRDKVIEIILRAKSEDSDIVFELFTSYFATLGQDALFVISPNLTVLYPSTHAAFKFIEQHNDLPPYYREFHLLLHLLFKRALEFITTPQEQTKQIETLLKWRDRYINDFSNGPLISICARSNHKPLLLEGIMRLRGFPDWTPELLHLFAVQPAAQDFYLLQNQILECVCEYHPKANHEQIIQMLQTLCLFNHLGLIEKALYLAVTTFMSGEKIGKKNIEVVINRVVEVKNFKLLMVSFEMLAHKNMSYENISREKVNELLNIIIHHLLQLSRVCPNSRPAAMFAVFNLFYENYPYFIKDDLLFINFADSVLCLTDDCPTTGGPKAQIDRFINLLASSDAPTSQQAKKFYALRKIANSSKANGKGRDYLFPFLTTLFDRFLMQDGEYMDTAHDLITIIFQELVDLCECYPEMRELLAAYISKFYRLKFVSGVDLSGPFFEKKKELIYRLQAKSNLWSNIDFTVLGLYLAEKKIVEYKPVNLNHLLHCYEEATKFFMNHLASKAFHHYIEVLKVGLYSFPLFKQRQIENFLMPLFLSHTHLLLKHQNQTALNALCSLITETNKLSAQKNHKNDFFQIACILHNTLIHVFNNFLIRSTVTEEDKAIAFKGLIAHLNATALLYQKNKSVVGAHLVQFCTILVDINPDALAKQDCFKDLARYMTATHDNEKFILDAISVIRTQIGLMGNKEEAEAERAEFDKLL